MNAEGDSEVGPNSAAHSKEGPNSAAYSKHPAIDRKMNKDARQKLVAQMNALMCQTSIIAEMLGYGFAAVVVDVNAKPNERQTGAIKYRQTSGAEMAFMVREIETKTSIINVASKMMKGDHDAKPLFGYREVEGAGTQEEEGADVQEEEGADTPEEEGVVPKKRPEQEAKRKLDGRLELLREITRGLFLKYGPISGVTKPVGRDGNVAAHEKCIIAYYLAGYQRSNAVLAYFKSGVSETKFDPKGQVVVAEVTNTELLKTLAPNAHDELRPLRWNINNMENPKKVKCPIFIRRYFYKITSMNRKSPRVMESMGNANLKRKAAKSTHAKKSKKQKAPTETHV